MFVCLAVLLLRIFRLAPLTPPRTTTTTAPSSSFLPPPGGRLLCASPLHPSSVLIVRGGARFVSKRIVHTRSSSGSELRFYHRCHNIFFFGTLISICIFVLRSTCYTRTGIRCPVASGCKIGDQQRTIVGGGCGRCTYCGPPHLSIACGALSTIRESASQSRPSFPRTFALYIAICLFAVANFQ